MAYRTYIKKVPGFTFLGPIMIIAGMLTAADTGLVYALNPDMVLDSVSMNFAVGYFVISAIFSFMLMHAGFLLYSGVIYSRYYSCFVLFFCLTAVLARVFLLGFGPYPWKIYLEAGAIIVALLYISQKKFRIRFEYRRSAWGITIFFGWVIVLMAGTYFYLHTSDKTDRVPPISTVKLDMHATKAELEPITLPFGVDIPENFFLSSVDDQDGELSVTFHNPQYGYLIINNFSGLTPIYKRMRILGYNNEYDFASRFFTENIGLLPVFVRASMSSFNINEYDRIDAGGLTLLVERSGGDNTIAHVFRNKHLIGEITLLSISANDTGLYNEIFSTLKFREPEHDAQKLYDEANVLINDKKDEQAKRLLAAAAIIRPDFAEYRFLLAKAFAATGYVSSAKKQLEAYVRLAGDKEKAGQLLKSLEQNK